MLIKTNTALIKFIVYSAVVNTLIVTPFANKDGMIIPKLMVMFSASMFVLAFVLLNRRQLLTNIFLKITIAISLVLLIQNFIISN